VTGSRAGRLLRLVGGGARRIASLYTARKWCLLAVVAALGVWCFERASATVSVADPPQLAQLGVGLRLTQPPAQLGLVYDDDATVELAHGCRNPVAVSMHVKLTKADKRFPMSVALAVADGAARKVSAVTVVPDEPGGRPVPMAVRHASVSDPVSRQGWIGYARMTQPDTLFVRFQADWVEGRGFRSCYVVLPDLTGEDAENSQALLAPKGTLQYSFEAKKGTLRMMTGGRRGLEPFTSTPPPDDLRTQTWTCSRDPNKFKFGTKCSAVGVVDESNAIGAASARIFVFGALLGVFLSMFIDLARQTRPRRSAGTSEGAH
jgi:hypothetical protein